MSADRAAAISIRGLTKEFRGAARYEGSPALGGIDLDVLPGEFLVLLGPSGCGKTTLLRSIAGLERPDGGSITIEGAPVFDAARRIDVSAEDRPVSMIFQSYALWPHMTAGKNVAFPLECHGVPRREIPGRVRDVLAKVGIEHLVDRYPGEMSGGQQQRLALARALVIGQRIVLFDEPLSNVDAQVRERLRLELIKMQRTLGFTAIYVTHDQSEAMELADRIAVMRHGHIAQLGAPKGIYQSPQSVHVARFLGQSNELRFTVEQVDAASGRVSGSGPVGRVSATWPAEDRVALPAVGGEAIAFGRPGDFTLLPDAAGAPGENAWRGTIEAVRFLGGFTQYVVTIGEGRLRCWASGDAALAEGTAVVVRIAGDKLQALPSA